MINLEELRDDQKLAIKAASVAALCAALHENVPKEIKWAIEEIMKDLESLELMCIMASAAEEE